MPVAWESPTPETRFILAIAIAFLCMAIGVVLILLFSRTRKSMNIRRTESLTQRLQGILNSIVVNATVLENIPASAFQFQIDEIKKIIDDSSFARQLLISQLIRLKKNLTGTSADVLRQVYLMLALDKFSFKRVKSLHWYSRARAMRELTEMQILESAPLIEKNLSSRNTILHEEAFMSLANLRVEKPLYFLDQYSFPVTDWMQLNVYEFLQKLDSRKLPDFSQWFYHSNKSVSLFAIRMAAQFKQYASAPKLAGLLRSPENEIKYAALKALTDLEVMDYFDTVTAIQAEAVSNSELARLFVHYLGKAAHSPEKLEALKEFLHHEDYSVRLAASESLLKDEAKRDEAVKLIVATGEKGESMVRHLTEPLLR